MSVKRRIRRKVLAFGAFDVLHLGHLHYLSKAKRFGNELIVVLARDSTLKKLKGDFVFSERERKELLESLRFVDRVVLGSNVGKATA